MNGITGDTPDQILQRIAGDGVVDEHEVRALENYVREDWVVDRPEVELLFRVNLRSRSKRPAMPGLDRIL